MNNRTVSSNEVVKRCPHGVRHPHPCRECEDAPIPHGLRFDVVGWICSVCGKWNGQRTQHCEHVFKPHTPETRTLRTFVDPGDPDEILLDFLNDYNQGNAKRYEFDKATVLLMLRAALRRVDNKETNPRITLMNDGRAMGGSDVCHTCEAHCTVINDLQTALDFVLRERITLHDGAFFQRAEVNHPNPSCGWYSFPSMPDGVSATLHEARDRLPANG